MDTTLFEKSYRTGLQRTINFLMSRGIPFYLAPDIAQSAWMRGWERRHQLRDETMILSWINAIALNQSRRSMRNVNREQEWTPLLKENQTTTLNSSAIDVAGILRAVDAKDRALLEAQLKGETAKELADAEGVTETTIRIRFFRARRSARQLCEPSVPLMSAA